jgi:hypothetical protein
VRKILTNLFWILVGTAHFWWQWVWSKLRWFLDAIALARLPEDVEHLFGPISMNGPSLIVLAIALVALYLTNRDFWHSLFSKRTSGVVAANDPTARGTKLITAGIILLVAGIVGGTALIIIGIRQNTEQRSEAHAVREPTKAPVVSTPSPAPTAEAPPIPSPAPPAMTQKPSIPRAPAKTGRKLVDSHVTPEFLLSLYEGNTTLRAETLISEHIGKWMAVSGPLGEIHSGRSILSVGERTPTLVVFAHPRKVDVYMWFSGEWVDRLSRLPKNKDISVIGQIKKIVSYNKTVELENCELLDSDPLNNAPTQSPNSPVRPRRRRRPSRG